MTSEDNTPKASAPSTMADLRADVEALETILGELIHAHMAPEQFARFLRGLRKKVLANAELDPDAAAPVHLIARIDALVTEAETVAHEQQKQLKAAQLKERQEQAKKAAKKKREKEQRWGKK